MAIPRLTDSSSSKIIVATALFIILFGNFRFAKNILAVFPFNINNLYFLITLAVLFACGTIIAASLFCFKFSTKPVLIGILLLSSTTAYFMDTYNVIIDDVMIDNIMRTDQAEVGNLISFRQILYIVLLGILPSIAVWKTKIHYLAFRKELFARLKLWMVCITLILISLFSSANSYASFIREHKLLRFYANPTYILYSLGLYGKNQIVREAFLDFEEIAVDAAIPVSTGRRKLVILVAGETVRSDHLSLNGYQRQTTPLLAQENIVNFPDVWSCGTSTAVSLPCMFSNYDRDNFNAAKAQTTENVLDVLQRTGVNVIWMDNNSDSKGVAARVTEENYKTDTLNQVCNPECRDIGMLGHLDDYIDEHPEGDIFIVLHQMGNHGPAYFRRYPDEFEKFIPACKTNLLQNCSNEEIINSYDNSLLYTDFFLSSTIEFLKENSAKFETTMLYISDHGESLGEYNLYLHGLPYILAPASQKHVPMILWTGECIDSSEPACSSLRSSPSDTYSHDNIFHTILGLMNVSTTAYNPSLDILENHAD